MVQPMVENFSECKFVNSGTMMVTGDKQQPITTNKLAPRDQPKETLDIILKSPDNSQISKDRGSNGINGHLVYVRRKLETDSRKINCSSADSIKNEAESVNENNSDSSPLKKLKLDCTRDQHWKERFGQLQMFLKACDQSNLEDYIQKLRSLPPAGRSKLAYELEKRAIHLTLEEGKELIRVRTLNVLGKAFVNRQALISARICSHAEVHLEK